ncbi:MAG: hypothetical protein OEZ36_02615 [Spirochaetota bacterium]|nr:hypothetical protein [Spirochaetota bacterium]
MVKQLIISLKDIIKSNKELSDNCQWTDEEKQKLLEIKESKKRISSDHYIKKAV